MTPAPPGRRLPRRFFAVEPEELAPRLLNKLIAHGSRVARIVEVEAYGGEGADAASHAFRGITQRTTAMFGPPGHLYVYFSYGVHWCANVVCGRDGEGAAVLLRAASPVAGVDEMKADRPTALTEAALLKGPGNLTRALGITKAHDGADLVKGDRGVAVLDAGIAPPQEIAIAPRVGVTKATELMWRFFIPNEASVSGRVMKGVPPPKAGPRR